MGQLLPSIHQMYCMYVMHSVSSIWTLPFTHDSQEHRQNKIPSLNYIPYTIMIWILCLDIFISILYISYTYITYTHCFVVFCCFFVYYFNYYIFHYHLMILFGCLFNPLQKLSVLLFYVQILSNRQHDVWCGSTFISHLCSWRLEMWGTVLSCPDIRSLLI